MKTKQTTIFGILGIIFMCLMSMKAHSAEPAGTNFDQLNGIMDRLCTKTINTAKTLQNANACRTAAETFVASHPVPNMESLDFREYKVGFIMAICSYDYKNDGINRPLDIKNACFISGVREFAENTGLYDISKYCPEGRVKNPLVCNMNLLETIRRSTHTEVEIFGVMKTRQNIALEAFEALPQDGPNYSQLNSVIDRICMRTINSRKTLNNGELCRKTSTLYVIKYPVPASTTLEFRRYSLGFLQGLCTANYEADGEFSSASTKSQCWAAGIDHLHIENTCDDSDIICMSNLVATVKGTVESKIHIQSMVEAEKK